MKKKTIEFRSLIDKYQSNCNRISEIADACEKEQRERNEAENKEFEALTRENQMLQMKMQALSAEQLRDVNAGVDTDTVLRENLLNNRKVTIKLEREVRPQTTAELVEAGIIAVSQQEVLGPVRTGLIWDKVGLTVRSGLAGKLRWPVHGKAVASFADEAELEDAGFEYVADDEVNADFAGDDQED